MAKNLQGKLHWKHVYKRGFKHPDSTGLAEEIQEQIEAFTARYDVYPDFDDDGAVVMRSPAGHIILYHGTTEDRAGAIVEEGFKTQGKHDKRIWFTRKSGEARRIARRRGEQRCKEAVVLRCEIDLGEYSNFQFQITINPIQHPQFARVFGNHNIY